MKTILEIGHNKWIAPDMQSAGKIADAINKLQPVNRDYRNSAKEVYVAQRGRDHSLKLELLSEQAVIVKTVDDAVKLRDKKDDKGKDLL